MKGWCEFDILVDTLVLINQNATEWETGVCAKLIPALANTEKHRLLQTYVLVVAGAKIWVQEGPNMNKKSRER